MHTTLSAFNSRKFRFWSFVSMVLLVFVHGYNMNQRYLQPWSVVEEPMTFNAFFQLLTANALFRFRIPMLFIISGFLYAMHDSKPYGERTKKRFRTLFMPYLLWSAIGLLFTYLLEMFPYGKAAVGATHMMQIDETRLYLHEYKWWEVAGRWIIEPVPFQLWFIRVLFIYNLAYPAIRWCVTTRARYVFFPIVIFLWLTTFGMGILEGEGLFFFALGIWMQKRDFDIVTPKKWWRLLPWMIVFIVASLVKTWLAFYFHSGGFFQWLIFSLLHKLIIFSGLITAWFGCNALVRYCMDRPWFVRLSAFSFMIYGLHVPLITYAIDPVFAVVNDWPHYRLIIYIFLPLAVILFCVGIGWILRRIWPQLYGLLTGGRGI